MQIKFTDRLSFKQASLTVLVGFLLGTLLSLIQVVLDYSNEDAAIDDKINALLETSYQPAARVAYNIDAELAQELVRGLLRSPGIIHAEIIDNNGTALGQASRPMQESQWRRISDALYGQARVFEKPLSVEHLPDETLGRLRVVVDTFAFGNDFLQRAGITLVTGFVRSLGLSLILLVLFYVMLTKPLVSIIESMSRRDGDTLNREPIRCPHGHERDEIGALINVTNEHLRSIDVEVGQRRDAEDRLRQYLNELENIVAARTTELKAANLQLSTSNQELEQARQQALAMAQARSDFLASMSHEIRTPLNGMLGLLTLALDGPIPSEQRQQLGIAQNSGKVLLELLNDILDLSKYEAGRLELESIAFNPAQLLEDTAQLLAQNAGQNVELCVAVSPSVPQSLRGDPTRVRQIISNLLSNALKFTREGSVKAKLDWQEQALLLTVKDTGIGMNEAALNRIFQPFTQASQGITREFGGTGLGLALTRRLCDAMQGEMTVTSHEGRGSVFHVRLPLTPLSAAEPAFELHGHVALVLNDTNLTSRVLRDYLLRWGLSLVNAEASRCDLLICNQAAELPRLRQRFPDVPLLYISPYHAFLSNEQAQALQPFQQLHQPVARHPLGNTIASLLGQQSELPRAQSLPSNRLGAHVLLVEDNPVNQLVAKGMLASLGCTVALAQDGQQALERLPQERVDLVLMDCNMPVLDGYEATRRLRADGRWNDLPVIALTANALAEDRQKCKDAGMNDYLSKPFQREDLQKIIHYWLQARTQASGL
ncbi:hybrid sensor histidine kinase/response regulator [Atopomonas sediminilitoris]|uniref:hybrid sensor histidine kinase/response regulator n=1 Tax=Atopomonas sediminilitoris TaxID=2919919 RepID=UPI001F4D8A0C|nr:response regulator [Atopomonas sediminilitoris]MCJ8168829.1 response regulator [Atopomonas sediminilitoris]